LLEPYHAEVVSGPLIEGAFVGLMVAEELGVKFTYAERSVEAGQNDLFSVVYRLPSVFRDRVRGKRVAIVNDVINAGSAVRGTYFSLKQHEAVPVVMATLLTLGDSARSLANSWRIGLETLATQANSIWTPESCPLCDKGIPLDALEG
jgi:orotate phosphoribosyltransferase